MISKDVGEPLEEKRPKKPVKINRALMSCENAFCRMNESRVCFIDRYVDLLCKPYVFRNECPHRTTYGDYILKIKALFGK
jgi:hypothetical protein